MKRHAICTALLLFGASLWAGSAEEILDKAAKAVLGDKKAEDLQSMIVVGKMTMPQGMSGQFIMKQKAGGKVVNTVEIPDAGLKIEQGCDGTDCYEINPMLGPRMLEGGEKMKMLDDANFSKNFDWRSYYTAYELMGEETINERNTYKLKLTNQQGLEVFNYYDTESYILVRTDMTLESPLGTFETKTTLTNYASHDGFLLPSKMIAEMMSHQVVMTIDDYQINPEIEDSVFAIPEQLAATTP